MMKRYFTTLSLIICCLLTSSVAMSHAATTQSEPFPSFINQFGQSAKFQLSRIKFPLKSPIVLLADDGETEKSFPFTQDMWPLLEEDALKAERIEQEDGSVYVSHFVVDNASHKVFEAGFEESEVDLRLEFELIDGKWYVVDGYTGWYGFDLPASELKEAVKMIQEDNKVFKSIHP